MQSTIMVCHAKIGTEFLYISDILAHSVTEMVNTSAIFRLTITMCI